MGVVQPINGFREQEEVEGRSIRTQQKLGPREGDTYEAKDKSTYMKREYSTSSDVADTLSKMKPDT